MEVEFMTADTAMLIKAAEAEIKRPTNETEDTDS